MTAPFPLQGIKILDLSRALSGPYAGRMLTDLGAEVVKLEIPNGDISQAFGQKIAGRSGLFVQLNAGKRNISLDLSKPEGVDVIKRMAEQLDVVIENFRPGVLDRLGIGYEALSAINPALILLSISGFGQWGPEVGRQAYAPVMHAESGLLGRQAQLDGRAPTDIALALADSLGALHGVIGVLAALNLRHTTGTGQHIDLSMLEAMLATDDYVHYSVENFPVWAARGYPWDAPGGPIMISSDPKNLWVRLSKYADLKDPDPNAAPEQKFAERQRMIGEWIAAFTDRERLKRELEQANLAWADIRTPETVLESPSIIERNVFATVPDGGGGTRQTIRMPYRFSQASCAPQGGPARCGQDNETILRDWLGLSDEEIEELAGKGVLTGESAHDRG